MSLVAIRAPLLAAVLAPSFAAFLILSSAAVAQTSQSPQAPQQARMDIRTRLAQSYERGGDFEAAVLIYEELFAKDSTNFVLIESLRRGYMQLKRHRDAAALLEHSLRLFPNDVNAHAQLGIVYVLNAEEEKAYATWERGVAIEPKNEMVYRIIGSAMVQSRSFEKAVDLYKHARAFLAKPDLFTSDIAYLYGIMLKYEEATAEYVNLILAAPSQLGFAQSRLAGFTGRAEGLAAAVGTTEKAVAAHPANVELRRLMAWLQMEAKDFEGAYETYSAIDKRMNAGGVELFAFAEMAFRENSFAVAAAAYEDLIGNHQQFKHHAETRYGHARSLEEIAGVVYDSLARTAPDPSVFDRSAGEYEQILFDFPRTETSARSLLRLGLIKKRTGDIERARRTLETIASDYKIFRSELTAALLELGSIYLALGDIGKARESYESIAGRAPFAGRDREQAAYRLAEVLFFEEKYGEALVVLTELTKNTLSESANDAIGLQLLIRENEKQNPEALRGYAEAEIARRQGKYENALEMLRSFTEGANEPPADLFLLKEGEILAEMGKYPDAVAAFQTVIDSFPKTFYGDRALFAIARAHDFGTGDVQKAIDAYQKLLEKYPSSIFSNRARKRIRDLRGDNT